MKPKGWDKIKCTSVIYPDFREPNCNCLGDSDSNGKSKKKRKSYTKDSSSDEDSEFEARTRKRTPTLYCFESCFEDESNEMIG